MVEPVPSTTIKRYDPPQEFLDSLVSVSLPDNTFAIVKENLTRMGIKSKTDQRLCQSCHILHKRGKYYIMHFKELFLLDGKTANFSEEDRGRRNMIAYLLSEWGLLKVDDPSKIESPRALLSEIHIIPHNQKQDWELESKYQIGKKNYDHA